MSAYLKLKPRLRRFVDEYVVSGRRDLATHACGFKPTSQASQYRFASETLLNPAVKAAIEEIAEQALLAVGVRAIAVMKQVAAAAFLDPARMFDEKGAMLPLEQIPEEVRCCIAAIEVDERWTGKGKARRLAGKVKRVKFESHLQAQQLLGQHLKLFANRHELTGADGTALIPKDPNDPLDTARRIAFLMAQGTRLLSPNTPLSAAPHSGNAGIDDDSTTISNSNKQH